MVSEVLTWQTGVAVVLLAAAAGWSRNDVRRAAFCWAVLLPVDFVTGIRPELFDVARYAGAAWLVWQAVPDLEGVALQRVRRIAALMVALALVRGVMALPRADGNGTKFAVVLLAATAVGYLLALRTEIHRAIAGGYLAGVTLSAVVSVMQALELPTLRAGDPVAQRYPGISTYTMLLTWQLAMGIILALYLVVAQRRGTRLWWAGAAALPFLVVAALANGAQGGFLGLGTAFLAFLLVMRDRLDRRHVTAMAAGLAATVAVAVVGSLTATIDLSSLTVLAQPKGLTNELARYDIAGVGLREFADSPLVGVSRSGFIEEHTIAPHFLPIDSAAVAGVLGLVAATALLGYLVVLVFRGPRSRSAEAVTGYLLLVVMTTNTITDSYGPFVGVSRATPLFLAVVALSQGPGRSRDDEPAPTEAAEHTDSSPTVPTAADPASRATDDLVVDLRRDGAPDPRRAAQGRRRKTPGHTTSPSPAP